MGEETLRVGGATVVVRTKRSNPLEDLREVMKTPAGRRFLHAVLTGTGLMDPVYVRNSETSRPELDMIHRDGRRSVGIGILENCRMASRDLTDLMWRENAPDDVQRQQKNQGDDDAS